MKQLPDCVPKKHKPTLVDKGNNNNIIIIIIVISSIKIIGPTFSLFCASCFNCYAFKRKIAYELLTSLKYSLDWFGDILVESGRCLSWWYIHTIYDNSFIIFVRTCSQ